MNGENSKATAALIVAAGRGSRLGGETPKQYRPLGGVPMLRYSVETCLRHPSVDSVTVVIHPDDLPAYRSAVAGLALAEPVAGGADRQESARRGLERLADGAPDRVLVHDAARPFVDAAIITRCLDALERRPGAIAALPVTDSLKRARDGLVATAVPRDGLWRAQTPQAFRYADILAAHRRAAGLALTDDAAVAAEAGMEVALVAGSPDNFKVTDAEDLARAERLLAARLADVRVGQGFDVHRFGPGDHVMLCGVPVPHDAALVGHSDADVALHAVTDAILGALGAGDIGQHFPPTDPAWRGAPSALFLRHAAGLAAERGGRIAHVDLTILCEKPRIGPHRAAMLAELAALLGLAPDRVSVKATTTERLGFLGRGEGIAAQAAVTLRLPV